MKSERFARNGSWYASAAFTAHQLPCDSCPGRSLGICRSLGDDQLAQLVSTGTSRRWKKREILYRPDEPVFTIFKIVRGVAIESRTLDDGRRQIVGIRRAGDLCGYPHKKGLHLYTAEALTDVEACGLERRRFESFFARHPDHTSTLSEDVTAKLWRATENMTVLGQLKSIERVAHFLVEMHEVHGGRQSGRHSLTLHLTRAEIADYLGLTLETVSRSFSKLRDLHVIGLMEGDEVAILNEDRLMGIAKLA
jgi:CRP/FNR family transcriptional regulator